MAFINNSKNFILKNPEIRIEPTNKCNAKCIMCPREKMKRSQGIMSFSLYKKIIDESVLIGAKEVSLDNFGETFLDPYIFDRAEYAKNRGLKTLTCTNASLLDEEKCKKVLQFFDSIRISMYGVTKEVYESIHKGLFFESTRDNLNRLFRMQKDMKSKTKIKLYFLLMEKNKDEMQVFLNLYKNIAEIAVWKPHNWSNGRKFRYIKKKKITCGRPFSGPLQVQWDGTVVPCNFDYDNNIILGDLNYQTIADIFRSKEYNRLRRAHLERDFLKYPFCNMCDQLNKQEDVLVYTNVENAKVGATTTNYVQL